MFDQFLKPLVGISVNFCHLGIPFFALLTFWFSFGQTLFQFRFYIIFDQNVLILADVGNLGKFDLIFVLIFVLLRLKMAHILPGLVKFGQFWLAIVSFGQLWSCW